MWLVIIQNRWHLLCWKVNSSHISGEEVQYQNNDGKSLCVYTLGYFQKKHNENQKYKWLSIVNWDRISSLIVALQSKLGI